MTATEARHPRILERVATMEALPLGLVLFVVLGLVYGLTATYRLNQSVDTVNTAVQAHQIAVTGSSDVAGIEGMLDHGQVVPGRGGMVTNRLPGPVGLGVVAYTLTGPLLPPVTEVSSLATFPFWPASLAAVLATAAAVAMATLALRRLPGIPPRVALVSGSVLAFGSATWSVSANALWTHSVTQLGLALALLAMAHGHDARAGAGLAVSILARPHTAFMAAGMGLGKGIEERRVRPVVVIGVVSATGLVLAMAYGMWLYGGGPSVSVGYSGYSDRVVAGGVAPSPLSNAGNIALLIVHPLRGLLPTTPVLLPLIVGLVAAWRSSPPWVRGLAVGAVAQLAIQGLVNPYTGGDGFFGSRLTLEFLMATLPLWAYAYVWLADRHRLLARSAQVLAVVSVGVHAVGATALSTGGA